MGKEKKESLGTLLTILGIFSGIWIGLIKVLTILIEKQNNISDESTKLISWIVLIFSFQILGYIFLIIKAIYFETSLSERMEINQVTLNLKKKESYTEVMNQWAFNLFMIIPIILVVVYREAIGEWSFLTGVIITIILLLEGFFLIINPLLKNKYKIKKIGDFNKFIKEPFEFKKTFLKSLVTAASIAIYCITIMALTSGINISLDKDRYSIEDNVIIQIRPYGLIPPKIIYVFYSNTYELIYNGTREPFPASLRIIQIPPQNLADKNYNSFITVITSYNYFSDKPYFGERYVKLIPVLIPSENKTTQVTENITNPLVTDNPNLS